MSTHQLVKSRRDDILKIAARHGATQLRVFGSASRDEDRAGSDLDLLVTFEPGRSLLDHVALMQDSEDLLGCKVDVVEAEALHWVIRDRVLRAAVPL